MPAQFNTPAHLSQPENPAENVNAGTTDQPEQLPEHLPEDFFQVASTDVPAVPKPKRKRNNDTRVCFRPLPLLLLLSTFHFKVQITRVALTTEYNT